MNKEISEMFWVAMDIIGGVILVMFLLGSITQARELFSTLEAREMAEERLAENKEWRGYEGDWITSADVCNLVAKHGGENTITIMISSTGVKWYADTVESSLKTTYRGGSNVCISTVVPNSTNTSTARVAGTGVPTVAAVTYKYSDIFTSTTPLALNEVLNEKASYAVKIGRDSTGVVRFIRIRAFPNTADYATSMNGVW